MSSATVGVLEVRFFSSILFGSGLLFIAMTFIATALAGTMPRWLVVATYLTATVQLFALGFSLWFTLLFPAWVLIVSIHFLVDPPRVPVAAEASSNVASID